MGSEKRRITIPQVYDKPIEIPARETARPNQQHFCSNVHQPLLCRLPSTIAPSQKGAPPPDNRTMHHPLCRTLPPRTNQSRNGVRSGCPALLLPYLRIFADQNTNSNHDVGQKKRWFPESRLASCVFAVQNQTRIGRFVVAVQKVNFDKSTKSNERRTG